MRARTSTQSGLTLIGLLIVVVIIAILAATAIVLIAGRHDAAARRTLGDVAKAQEAYFEEHQSYASAVTLLDFEADPNVTVDVSWGDAYSYIMCAQHNESPSGWEYASGTGEITHKKDGC